MTKIGIVGASGYSGSELLRFLVNHPGGFNVALATSETYAGQHVDRVLPHLRGFIDLVFEPLDIFSLKDRVDVVVLAVPHKVAMTFAPQIIKQGLRVVDFSADYRLYNAETYQDWYDVAHSSAELIQNAVYGLPERYREKIRDAQLVANPGCYPTSAILASMPLLNNKLVELDSIIVDSKSGISGAGPKPKDTTHFPNRESNLVAYNIGKHRHTPEIEQEMSAVAGEVVTVTFTPHLVPMTRGILSTVYAKLKQPLDSERLLEDYRTFYNDEPFIRVLDDDEYPQTKSVLGSNFCDIGLAVDERTQRVVVMAAIDNLGKGAAGAAVQNLNLMFDCNETDGLITPGLMP
ncbi:N-acetyl-gamma-glutamyl-phosphate reductase [Candidatus Poribacteria bacterium]|nr:N-acetyl-gamma-glutamyl-phosphate reductase [Candidatus Poribacteria bacterium]MYB64373.1 N-acetyl-gamma-glutamyl-phosphate reductase [Candidatus Poribacteria bacterium]